jgi:uncharacterized protein YijF (DUF1287 family)
MKCERCGGSVIDTWDEGPFGQRKIPKCINCGREHQEGVDMARELTEEQKAEKREYQRQWRENLSPEKKEERRKKALARYLKRKGQTKKSLVKVPKTLAPREVNAVGPDGQQMVFIGTQSLIAPAKEIRVELVYTLTAAKILKES